MSGDKNADIKSNIEENIHGDIDDLNSTIRLAIQRTILANTRTFSAWVRTGLSSVLAGFAIVKFMGDNHRYETFVSTIGISFVLIGVGVYIYGYLSYRQSYMKLDQEKNNLSVPLHVLLIITLGLIMTSLLIIALIILYKE